MRPNHEPKRAVWRTRIIAAVLITGLTVFGGANDPQARAQTGPDDTFLFRIGTGGAQGTYFPIGSLIARAISESDESCARNPGCGVSNLLAVAQQSNGSVSNVEAISAGVLEAGLVQADIAHWAYTGTGVFAKKQKRADIRAIASLYRESVHVVVRRGSGMRVMDDLAGRRVSLDEPGSGTLVDARIVLNAYELDERDLKPIYIKPQFAAEKLTEGTLDAFFIVAGFPTKSVMELTSRNGATLVPIDYDVALRIESMYPFLTPSIIPADTYPGVPETRTISVYAQLLVGASLSDELAYNITRELWSERTMRMLEQGHLKGREIKLDSALQGIPIPLHPGAEKFYRERGMLLSADRG
ncbi:MAG: TAXI family TRAP transporter solute-binding subunit [Gammaproteobacteria bacterium]|nr:TAXI family TRAP transporter solute-binding subunit [Gammaproteobacteria bacterium]